MSVEKVYKLKQITPMIHFQADQVGACIRATELKPKLDRFLIKKYGSDLKKEWYLGDTEALNYKVRIVLEEKAGSNKGKNADSIVRTVSEEFNSFYFANMGDDDELYKKSVRYEGLIDLHIICFINDLQEMINKCIEEFFLITNFGTRQSKGFGSFIVVGEDRKCKSLKEYRNLLNESNYNFFYCSYKDNINNAHNIALAIYSVMKGGINRTGYNNKSKEYKEPDKYIKSYIQKTFIETFIENDENKNTIGSDKAFIKSRVVTNYRNLPEHKNSSKINYKNYYFVRALLGLADHYEYKDDIRKGTAKIYHFYGTKKTASGFEFNDSNIKEGKGIKRCKSPICISFVEDGIFFIFEIDSMKKLFGEWFFLINDRDGSFSDAVKNKDVNSIKGTLKRRNAQWIQVPESFDCEGFIKDFVDYYNGAYVQERLKNIPTLDIGFGVKLIDGKNEGEEK